MNQHSRPNNERRSYWRALNYFSADRTRISILIVLIALSVALGLLQAWPMAILVDSVLTPTPRTDWIHRLFLSPLPNDRLSQVIGVTLIGMCLKMFQDTLTLFRAMLNYSIKYNGTARVRRELFDKLVALGLPYHHSTPQGDAIYRLSNDAYGPFGILDTMLTTAVAAVTLVAMTVVMLSRTIPLTLFALSIAPVLILINLHFGRKIKLRSAESKQIDADLTTVIQRAMQSLGLMLAFRREGYESARFNTAVERSIAASLRLNWQENLYPLFVQIIFALGGAVVFGYGGYLVYRDQFVHPIQNGLTTGDLMVFMAYLGQLWDPLGQVAGFNARIQNFAAAAERVFYVLDQQPLVKELPRPASLPPKPRELKIENVSFGYSREQRVLKGIDARIAPGEMVAFLGRSGVGKSTLLNLLPRFYDPLEGCVRLDGEPLPVLCIADLRGHIALVSQETPVIAGTIAGNIAYGRPDAAFSEIVRAAEMAGAADFIAELPGKYDAPVGEGGFNFSGGQRQRLAIARAFLSDAPILILDEPTSALDVLHEQTVMESLQKLRGQRTIVLVTHRVVTVETCDQIFVMDEGLIVETGTHMQLMTRGGLYSRLLRAASPDV